MKIKINDIEIETERDINDDDFILQLIADFIKTLRKERKEKLLSLLEEN